jgi:putative DNA primase/helicase
MYENAPEVNTASKLYHALAWAARGFRVFPVQGGSKLPVRKDWPSLATTDPETIRRWWTCGVTGLTHNYNIGFCTTGWIIADLDTKDGKNGLATFKELGLGLTTLTIRTPSGGFHAYYSCLEDKANAVDLLWPGSGLDVRAFHGYVLAPGSEIGGKVYEVLNDAEVEFVPQDLDALLKPPRLRGRQGLEFADDSEEAIAQGRHYLEHNAPIAIEGEGGNTTAYRVAATLVRDFGLSEVAALDLLVDRWNPRCEPPWSEDELAAIVEHAEAYGTGAKGGGTLEAAVGDLEDFIDPADVQEAEPVPRAKAPRGAGITLRTLEGLEMEPIDWLWKGWLARGKFHLIAGAPEAGKTTIGLSMVAAITAGGRWPDDTRARIGSCLVWTSEDGLADTIKPRLMAMGADLSRVFFIENQRDADGRTRPFDPARDMLELSKAADGIPGGIDFLLLDPVVAAVGAKTNSHNNAETRNALQPLLDFAEKAKCAVLGITHFTKGTAGRDPVERVTGSIAFGALARIVMIAAKNSALGSDAPRILVRAKTNIGPGGGGFGYDVVAGPLHGRPDITATRISWREPIEGSARDLLSEAESDPEASAGPSKIETAREFLYRALANGERGQRDIEAEAQREGIAARTLKRASEALAKRGSLLKRKDGMSGAWHWRPANVQWDIEAAEPAHLH